jgi:hypothetical protein
MATLNRHLQELQKVGDESSMTLVQLTSLLEAA